MPVSKAEASNSPRLAAEFLPSFCSLQMVSRSASVSPFARLPSDRRPSRPQQGINSIKDAPKNKSRPSSTSSRRRSWTEGEGGRVFRLVSFLFSFLRHRSLGLIPIMYCSSQLPAWPRSLRSHVPRLPRPPEVYRLLIASAWRFSTGRGLGPGACLSCLSLSSTRKPPLGRNAPVKEEMRGRSKPDASRKNALLPRISVSAFRF
jgi:hypothetical protein